MPFVFVVLFLFCLFLFCCYAQRVETVSRGYPFKVLLLKSALPNFHAFSDVYFARFASAAEKIIC